MVSASSMPAGNEDYADSDDASQVATPTASSQVLPTSPAATTKELSTEQMPKTSEKLAPEATTTATTVAPSSRIPSLTTTVTLKPLAGKSTNTGLLNQTDDEGEGAPPYFGPPGTESFKATSNVSSVPIMTDVNSAYIAPAEASVPAPAAAIQTPAEPPNPSLKTLKAVEGSKISEKTVTKTTTTIGSPSSRTTSDSTLIPPAGTSPSASVDDDEGSPPSFGPPGSTTSAKSTGNPTKIPANSKIRAGEVSRQRSKTLAGGTRVRWALQEIPLPYR